MSKKGLKIQYWKKMIIYINNNGHLWPDNE